MKFCIETVTTGKRLLQIGAQTFVDYINPFVDEKAFILRDKKVGLAEEKEWLAGCAKSIDGKSLAFVIAWCGKDFAGDCEVRMGRGRERFNASFGLSVGKKYRGFGLGRKLLQKGISIAKRKFKAHKIIIEHEEENLVARKLYESMGFVEICRLKERIYYEGRFMDTILMELREK